MWTRAGARGGVAVGGGRRRRGQAALFRGGKRPKICHESRQNMFLFFRFLKTHSTSRVVSGRVCGGAVARFNACHCPFHSLPLTFSLPSHCLPALIMRRCQKHRGCGRYRRMRCFRPTRLTVSGVSSSVSSSRFALLSTMVLLRAWPFHRLLLGRPILIRDGGRGGAHL